MSDVKLSQSYAVLIEYILRDVFNCERFGVGGIVNSDYIRKHPIASIIHAATYLYAKASSEQKEIIEKFIQDIIYYSEWSIDMLLSFDSRTKEIDGITYGLEFENGRQQLEHIIEEFKKIVNLISKNND